MTIQRQILWGIIALILPFILIVVIWFQGAKSFEGTEYRVRITGYDPRDILRGHYVQFRYEWPNTSKCKPNQICVACFSGNPKRPQIIIKSFIQQNVIAQDQSCQVHWRLNSVAKPEDVPQPVAELLRFYIPELEASQLERLLRLNQDRFEIGVIPHADGTAVAKNFYINGKRLSDYLKD